MVFYETTRFLFLVGKCGGLLPIEGFTQPTSEHLRFKWKSLYMLFFFLPSLITQTVITGFFMLDFFNSGFKMPSLPGVTFWTSCVTSIFFYWKSSRKICEMMKEIECIEATLSPQHAIKTMKRKIHYVMIFYTLFGIVDCICYLLTSYYRSCCILQDDSGLYFKSYIVHEYIFIFKYVPFSYVLGVILQLAIIQTTFYWSFNDAVFIICTVYLEKMFENFNRLIFRGKNKVNAQQLNWVDLQFQYTQLTKLVRIMDRNISPVICVAFVTSFLLLCQKLFIIFGYQNRSTLSHKSPLQYASFFISTAFMASRILLILFLASRLHTTSRKSLKIIGLVPSSNYNRETLRFMDQVYYSTVALSGMGLFYFTRETIISVVSVIATYELVLFQM